jgi:anaerobic ribonucleoside-triphosphate reductase activating protein
MRVGSIVTPTYTDGPGERVSLYTSGCSIRCLGCQNPHLFKSVQGQDRDVYTVAQQLLDAGRPISILGGEPFDQSYELALLLTYIGLRTPATARPILVYTGYTWEQLLDRAGQDPRERWALDCVRASADILIDGPFEQDNTDDRIQWRGSYNQRVIDLAAMRHIPSSTVPLVRDWDGMVAVTVAADGRIIATAGAMQDLADILDDVTDERMCGAAPRAGSKERPAAFLE